MDANKFLNEYDRMCKSYDDCPECPLCSANGACSFWPSIYNEEIYPDIIKIVEDWSAAHPRKTRQSVFLEQWPTAKIDESGCLDICPYLVSAPYRNKYGYCANDGVVCCDCRREFWMQEVE
jgi:hypothetical protein|nr:MAG TPA: hypothetical protein [Caudoviricetes sp.]